MDISHEYYPALIATVYSADFSRNHSSTPRSAPLPSLGHGHRMPDITQTL